MLLPSPPSALDSGWDKLNHVLAFAGPMFAGLAALADPTRRTALVLAAGLLAWGAALEFLQGLLPPRSADPADWLADAIGVALGAALFAAAAGFRSTKPR
jgi:VanZ family protein